MIQLLTFALDGNLFGLQLDEVERVIRAVAVTPLPQSPEVVLGIINVGGEVLPVFSARKTLGLREKALAPSDQLILLKSPRRRVALLVDGTFGIIGVTAEQITRTERICASATVLGKVARGADELILIYGLEGVLSPQDERLLDAALAQL